MLEEISYMLYEAEDAIMLRFREGESVTEDEKEKIEEFVKSVKKHLDDGTVSKDETIIVVDIIYTFMLYQELNDFAAKLYQIIVNYN